MDNEVDHERLRARMGTHLYRQRINTQAFHAAPVLGQGRTWFHPENSALAERLITMVLRAVGLYWLGKRNARRIQVFENRVVLRRLPDAFQGFRILQISDPHLDIDPGLVEPIAEQVRRVAYDLCVITGDFRAKTYGDWHPSMALLERLVPHLHGPIYGVLGNHDCLEMVPRLEELGIRILLNEHVAIERAGQSIYLAGVDDPHFYETDDFERAIGAVPHGVTVILLAHSAERYRPALACGVDLMLSGHTHGGQICLPGGFALYHNASHPRSMGKGAWRYQDLQGYTSRGTGVCMAPVRFFCPAEITVHTLERAPRHPA